MAKSHLTGVNLGGWLILEKWITPSLFGGMDAEDEYTFCERATTEQLKKLKRFRDTFITQQDFTWLAEHGIEAVRLPVGYWLFGDAEPYLSTVQYVDKAFQWAEAAGIQILLDLHGAPGSQNGNDHSGRIGDTGWHHEKANPTRTLEVIDKLARRYAAEPALLGISLLNEPDKIIPKAVLLDYYQKAYKIIRAICGDDIWVVFNDGYAASQWRQELPQNKFTNVYIDFHHYQVFSPTDKRYAPWIQLLRTRFQLPLLIARFRRYHPVVVGEWSLALGSGHLSHRSPAAKDRIALQYGKLQRRAYTKTAASFFWTYKTEDVRLWSLRDCIEQKLL